MRGVDKTMRQQFRKDVSEATNQEMYQVVSRVVEDLIIDRWIETQKQIDKDDAKIVYYMSMEFLVGRALGNNIINLNAYKEIKGLLDELGFDLNVLEDEERDPALGNGGLGRLAACFMESLATLGYPAYGCGIRYRYGMFKQCIKDGFQEERPDDWLMNGYPFELRRGEYEFEVRFNGYIDTDYLPDGSMKFHHKDYHAIKAVPYDMPIVGYDNNVVNTLIMWDARPVESFGLESFDRGDYEKAVEQQNIARNLCEVLYPCDNHIQGKELRLKQQYFFVSASVQRAIHRYLRKHDDITKLYEKVCFQLNDTHPTVAVAELMRILIDDYGLEWDEAWDVTTKTCAYTNHTIMSEALEKWPIDIFKRLLPRVYQIIEEINRRFGIITKEKFGNDQEKLKKVAILYDGQVRMANLAIAAGFSVNGVAALHTEILKERELHEFYELFPEKFNNKTNGVTQRRFLLHANRGLSDYITERIGDGWITDLSQIKGIAKYADDPKEQELFMQIKKANKERLADYIYKHNGIKVDTDSIFDCQTKRLHEYKRQLMNILHVMYLYEKLKEDPDLDMVPQTFIFGAKAAAGYHNAKLTIKLINSVADVVNNDARIKGKIKVVFIEDYCVSNAEIIIAGADVSEQISTASKEASGTGNMKYMMNGALTIGTMDGANVEMAEEVGKENMFIFGMSAAEVMEHERLQDYNPKDILDKDDDLTLVVYRLVDGTYSEDKELFKPLMESLLFNDYYFTLADFRSYEEAQRRVNALYKDKSAWAKKAMLNTACSGKFSSDRTIRQYVDEIWKLKPIKVELPEK